MNKTKLSRGQLAACKFHGITQYPELGVLSKLLLGVYKVPSKPTNKRSTKDTTMCCFEGSSMDELISSLKANIREELRYMKIEEDSVVGYDIIATYEGELEICVTFETQPTKEKQDKYEAEISLHKKMLSILFKVQTKALEYAYMDDQDRRENIEAQIKELQKQL